MRGFWYRIKQKLKKGIAIKLFGIIFTFRVQKASSVAGVPEKTLALTEKKKNSWQQPDNFKNDFKFNMFVEHALGTDVKKKIIAQVYYKNIGRYPNIDNPKTLSEKVLWLKLYYENPLIALGCDKARGKEYIDKILGPGYTVPIIKEYHDVNEIVLDELPDKFALKVNWATGCNIIVDNKKNLHLNEVKYTLDQWTLPWFSSYYGTFNVGYKNVKPVIFAEEYLDIPHNSTEYKVFCLNGKAEFTLVELDYFGKAPKRAYYDKNWKEVPWQFANKFKHMEKVSLGKMPENYPEIIRLAEKLAEPFPYIRVDFYDIKGKLYVGELTFYSGGGLTALEPAKWDAVLGEKLDLSKAIAEIKEENKKERGDVSVCKAEE